MNQMCVPETVIREKARKMPISYLADCQAASTPNDKGEWCFELKTYTDLAKRYAKYSVSEADPDRSRISGCCDRADQY
jgi:hypothetical protein